jgi:hypothetical protein
MLYTISLKCNTLPNLQGENLYGDSYSVYIKDKEILVFNHAIKGISNITSGNIDQIIKKNWKQNEWFNLIIHKKEQIKITFFDGEILICKLIYYCSDKIFTDNDSLSLIQKGSIAYIEKNI